MVNFACFNWLFLWAPGSICCWLCLLDHLPLLVSYPMSGSCGWWVCYLLQCFGDEPCFFGWKSLWKIHFPIPSMGLEYLHTFTNHTNQPKPCRQICHRPWMVWVIRLYFKATKSFPTWNKPLAFGTFSKMAVAAPNESSKKSILRGFFCVLVSERVETHSRLRYVF